MRTVLYDEHVKSGAKVIDFHGWEMPLQYTGIIDEHMAVRTRVGIFDVSHMGDVVISGKDAYDFVNMLFPSNISKLKDGTAMYTTFLNNEGFMIDDTVLYRLSDDRYFFVPNAATTDTIKRWVEHNSEGYNVKINDYSRRISCVAVQGPLSGEVSERLGYNVFPKSFTFILEKGSSPNSITSDRDVIISGTGYTGEKGFEILVPNEDAIELWKKTVSIIREIDGRLCGLGSRDSLRMEKGMLLSGTDFNSDRTPYEASISFVVDTEKDFIGKIAMLEKKKSQKELFRGFIVDSKIIPRNGDLIYKDGRRIGKVTSGTYSPILKKSIALGYIDREFYKSGTVVDISTRGKMLTASVHKPRLVP